MIPYTVKSNNNWTVQMHVVLYVYVYSTVYESRAEIYDILLCSFSISANTNTVPVRMYYDTRQK